MHAAYMVWSDLDPSGAEGPYLIPILGLCRIVNVDFRESTF